MQQPPSSKARALALLHNHGIEIVQEGSKFKYSVRGKVMEAEYPCLTTAVIGAEHHVKVQDNWKNGGPA